MAFTFSNLAQAVWQELGKVLPFHQFVASGGSTTTVANDDWTQREDAPEDNYCIDWTAVVVRDAGGASAAPEGQLARITGYVASTNTYTFDTMTAAVASGDEVMIANSDIPLMEMYAAANRALRSVGDVENVDTTFTLSTSTDRYTLPTGAKMEFPLRLEYTGTAGTATDERLAVPYYKVTADGYVFIPYFGTNQIFLTYIGPHSQLTAYNSTISEDIHPQLAIAATTAEVLQWLNGTQGGGTQYYLQRENKALQDLTQAKAEHPPKRIGKYARWFVA